MPDRAAFFEILDLVTGNTLAGFDDVHEAHDALARFADEQPGSSDRLALALFDTEGEALEVRLVNERIPA
jgi:hypothetical protein